jgi:hypothetical protein
MWHAFDVACLSFLPVAVKVAVKHENRLTSLSRHTSGIAEYFW